MTSSVKELKQQLVEAGNKLLQPLSSVDDELLQLLDQVDYCLCGVEQSPAISIRDALSPLMEALVADELLRHSDVDVKVAVASCVSEITRISAPKAPYDDDKMKDVFQLIVSSFENFHDQCSRSYTKRALVLETMAKVRSCVIMLDLECVKLITEMFQHFLKEIRDDHSEDIFAYMATIMTVVLEQSEEATMKLLLTPLLATVKKHNKEVTPVAKKLVKTVFANCAPKLKPYLAQAVESLDLSLDEHSTKSAKRKRSSGKDKATEDVQYAESLVSLKVKVWWPHDRSFYEGVISAFDSGKRKHTVSYDDGEIEVLNLRKERWEFIQGDEVSEEDQIARPDVSSVVQNKKCRIIAESSAKRAKVKASPNRQVHKIWKKARHREKVNICTAH